MNRPFCFSAVLAVGLGVAASCAQAQTLLTILQPYGVTAADEIMPSDPNYQQVFNFGQGTTITKIGGYAGGAPNTTFGFYTGGTVTTQTALNNSTPATGVSPVSLWTDSVANGTTALVKGVKGLYIDNLDPNHLPGGKYASTPAKANGYGGYFYTQTALNFDGHVHMEEFLHNGIFYLGFQDLSLPYNEPASLGLPPGVGSYDNLVVSFKDPPAVPEPNGLSLTALGLLGLGALHALRARKLRRSIP